MGSNDFAPNWASPPGETITDVLEERGLSIDDLAEGLGQSPEYTRALVAGQARIDSNIAKKLENILGSSAAFWIARDSQFRRDSHRLEKDTRQDMEEWLDELPFREATRFGWLKDSKHFSEKVAICLKFFDVSSVREWRLNYEHILADAAFRTSPSFTSKPGSVAVWLREGEIEASAMALDEWNPARFKETLEEIRGLTRQKDPKVFIPEMQRRCAQCGVAVAVIRAPSGCRASGATRFLSPEKALLLLSARFLSDDHFWFSFFHEAGHLLLHGPEKLFLEGVDRSQSQEELEANEFAEGTLVPSRLLPTLRNLPADRREIIRFAIRAGISPGIVVGQLQHFRRLGRDQFNNLKRRFQWNQVIGR